MTFVFFSPTMPIFTLPPDTNAQTKPMGSGQADKWLWDRLTCAKPNFSFYQQQQVCVGDVFSLATKFCYCTIFAKTCRLQSEFVFVGPIQIKPSIKMIQFRQTKPNI